MSTRHLDRLFNPQSIAVIGASERPQSAGGAVLRNLLDGGYSGDLAVVNRKNYDLVLGVPCFAGVQDLPWAPDLALLCTPATTIPGLIRALNRKRARVAVVIMGGLAATPARDSLFRELQNLAGGMLGRARVRGRTLTELALNATDIDGVRMLGPNTLGVVVPERGLNASYIHLPVAPGPIALVSESAVFALAMTDWAAGRELGFSHLVTLGDDVDIGVHDVLEYLAEIRGPRIVLTQIDNVRAGGRLLSSLRAVAHKKTVVVLKTRIDAPMHGSDAPLDRDRIFSAAMRRAGAVRVSGIDQVQEALDILTRVRHITGPRLAIVANGEGLGVLARDSVLRMGGQVADLADATLEKMATLLPAFWQPGNPVNLQVVASAELFGQAIGIVGNDPGVDAVLVLYTPTLSADAGETADAVVRVGPKVNAVVLAGFVGEATARPARQVLDKAGIPAFATPERAVAAWLYLARHQRGQVNLWRTPAPEHRLTGIDTAAAWGVVGEARDEGHHVLMPSAVSTVLGHYGIACAQSRFAVDEDDAVRCALDLGFPVAVRILYADGIRPFASAYRFADVRTDCRDASQVVRAVRSLAAQLQGHVPAQVPRGFEVQPMRRGLQSHKLNLGFARDRAFGPVMVFGSGASQAAIRADRHYELPPLTRDLARELIAASAMNDELIRQEQDTKAGMEALIEVLLRLSQLAVDLPVISALEIQPLIVNRHGLVVIGAGMAIGEAMAPAITPYPAELARTLLLPGLDQVTLRPIRGEDEPRLVAFLKRLSARSRRLRFFGPKSGFTHQELARLTQLDYAREMAFVATHDAGESIEILGVVRAWFDADNIRAEFAVVVGDDVRGMGLGHLLVQHMLDYCKAKGTLELMGTVLAENVTMLELASKLGFTSRKINGENALTIRLGINDARLNWQRERLLSTD